jgi:hypothetical protein
LNIDPMRRSVGNSLVEDAVGTVHKIVIDESVKLSSSYFKTNGSVISSNGRVEDPLEMGGTLTHYRNSLLQGHSKRYSVGFRLSEQKSVVHIK